MRASSLSRLALTALCSALLAGCATGFWSDPASLPGSGEVRRFEPCLDAARREALYAGWKRAVERSRGWTLDA